MITELEYKTLKNILISEFPVWEVYDAMRDDKWEGYKPTGIDDIYRLIGEKFRSVEKDEWGYYHLQLEGTCSSAGFLGGFIDGYMVISWSFNSICFKMWEPVGQKTPLTIGDVRKYSDIYSEIDCIEFLRMYKIYKLWQNKNKNEDKEIITTTPTTSSAQG